MAKKKKNSSTSIPVSSKQPHKSNPPSSSSRDGPPSNSPKNPRRSSPIMSFSLDIAQAGRVKLALLSLSAADFNPTGQGRVDIYQDGFKITVWNHETFVVANQWWHPKPNSFFECSTPFSPKMIDLKSLVEVFNVPRVDEDIIVSVVHGSNQLSFSFGTSEIFVDLGELSAEFPEFPVIAAPCGAVMTSEYLQETLISDIMFQEGTPRDVTVKMTGNSMNITAGTGKWNIEIGETRGWKPEEEELSRTFQWPHFDLLMETSYLTNNFKFYFLDDPYDSIMFRFSITKSCDVRYIKYKDKTCSFYFNLYPAGPLMQAIQSLADSGFCQPPGLGMVQVKDIFFEIAVRNSDTGVTGFVVFSAAAALTDLPPSGLLNFTCENPSERKMLVNVKDIENCLSPTIWTDFIQVHKPKKSNEISFKSVTGAIGPFTVELLEMANQDDFLKCDPYDIRINCEAIVPSKVLSEMIPLLIKGNNLQTVDLKIVYGFVFLAIGAKTWRCGCSEKLREQKCRVKFEWPHIKSLKLASTLTDSFGICILANPPNSIMLRFKIHKAGYLAYIKYNICVEQASSEQSQTYSFSFNLLPAGPLMQALQSLTDSSFCKAPGLGMVQVNNSFFEIAVYNSDSKVTGLIQLPATDPFLNLKCDNFFERKILVNVKDIEKYLSLTQVTDVIVVHKAVGSDQISFKCVTRAEDIPFAVKLLDMANQDELLNCRSEDITIQFEAIIPSKVLKEIIPHLTRKKEVRYVELEVLSGFVTLSISGVGKTWDCGYHEKLQEQQYRAWFQWPHSNSLKQATSLGDWFGICVLSSPPNSIMLRFKVYESGYLAYIKEVSLKLPDLTEEQLIQTLAIPTSQPSGGS